MSLHKAATATFPKGYIPTLDGWRAVAILLVLVAHGGLALLQPFGVQVGDPVHGWTKYGTLGVDVFFGISGLLICSRLLEELDKRGRISLRGFYIRRACRILPPYLLLLGVVALLGWASVLRVSSNEIWACLLFYRNYLPDALGGWFTGHFWSLAVEEHFYLLWPGLLVLLAPARARWLAITGCVAIALWRPIEFRYNFVGQLIPGLLYFGRTDIRLDGLLWGCVAALSMRSGVTSWPIWRSHWTFPGLVAAFIGCVVAQPPFALTWQPILIVGLLLSTILRPHAFAGRLLESPPLQWVGRLSYSLYLWQQLFLTGDQGPAANWFGLLQQLPVNFIAIFAFAWLSYRYVEQPMIRLGHRLARPVTPGRMDGEAQGGEAPALARVTAAGSGK